MSIEQLQLTINFQVCSVIHTTRHDYLYAVLRYIPYAPCNKAPRSPYHRVEAQLSQTRRWLLPTPRRTPIRIPIRTCCLPNIHTIPIMVITHRHIHSIKSKVLLIKGEIFWVKVYKFFILRPIWANLLVTMLLQKCHCCS